MKEPEDRHNLRLPKELKAKLAHARIDSGRSMNAEILDRLERSFAPDPATQMIEALQPVAALSDEDRQQVGALIAKIGSILSKDRPR
ncbi:Arc family DNA-binding protein [Afipia carboxidovorans]|uniref:Arc family DNA-binding protein n=1 Tax=Afipia carboxidovorans TaxID=40137 RepID=UPI0030D05DEC